MPYYSFVIFATVYSAINYFAIGFVAIVDFANYIDNFDLNKILFVVDS